MKQAFLVLVAACLMACNNEPEVYIMGTQFDFTQDEGVDDSLVYGEYEPVDSTDIFGPFLPGEKDDPVDSLQNVNELLDYLETLPSE